MKTCVNGYGKSSLYPDYIKSPFKKQIRQAVPIEEIKMAVADGKQFKFLDEAHINPSFLEVFEF